MLSYRKIAPERAYQKQPTIFQNKKRVLVAEGGKEVKEKLPRYHKSVGLGFKTPREAIDGTYIDKKCPFTGNVSIRGRILSGVVIKMKMQRTIVIRRDYLPYIRRVVAFECIAERAYQKQPTIFQNKKRVLVADGGKEVKEKLPRYHKSVGLGFKTPREAIDGTYIDKKCLFTGNVSIRGRILSGVVTKMKMQRTIVIRGDYLHYIRKYNRFYSHYTERAYQKQPTISQNKKRVLVAEGAKEVKEKLPRYHKSVGLGFKTPREAIDGTYIDKECPFTGNVSIRGRILSGVVTKMKMQRTIVIRRDYLPYIRKYNRFEKRHKNISVHLSPCFRDVSVGECRPLSKTVRFNILKVTKAAGAKKQFQKF
ncbi:hypothetical protein NQZ68_005746 [Dissostichus eleginoides]|nr:hypothetical protein NQZ68_005746 [Dissostichus eleginoides]